MLRLNKDNILTEYSLKQRQQDTAWQRDKAIRQAEAKAKIEKFKGLFGKVKL